MKAFVSWSGGKDCMFALYREQLKNENEVVALVNMCNIDGNHSRSHGLKTELIKNQGELLKIPLIQKKTESLKYEESFKAVISELKQQGVEAGIFGDIYLEPHREWIDRVCNEMGIEAIYPLWGQDTGVVLKEFVAAGFKTKVVSVNNDKLDKSWLGRVIDDSFVNDILPLENIDACAENGEYHTFVFDGPNFKKEVEFVENDIYFKDNHWFLPIEIK